MELTYRKWPVFQLRYQTQPVYFCRFTPWSAILNALSKGLPSLWIVKPFCSSSSRIHCRFTYRFLSELHWVSECIEGSWAWSWTQELSHRSRFRKFIAANHGKPGWARKVPWFVRFYQLSCQVLNFSNFLDSEAIETSFCSARSIDFHKAVLKMH